MAFRNLSGLALILLTPIAVIAQPTYQAHRCDNCTGVAQMQGVAIQHGVGTRYVFNLETAEVRKFSIERYCGSTPQGGDSESGRMPAEAERSDLSCQWWQYLALSNPVEQEVSDLIAEVSATYHALGRSLFYRGTRSLADVTTSSNPIFRDTDIIPPGSQQAYYFVTNSTFRSSVMNYIGQLVQTDGNLVTLNRVSTSGGINLGVIKVDLGVQSQTQINIIGQWPDGSSIETVYNKQTGKMNYVLGSAQEANGTLIPDESHDVTYGNPGPLGGSHDADNIEAWLNAAALRGIDIGTGGSVWSCGVACGGGSCRISCVRM